MAFPPAEGMTLPLTGYCNYFLGFLSCFLPPVCPPQYSWAFFWTACLSSLLLKTTPGRVRVKHKHFGVAHLALLNLTLNTSPPPLLLVRSPPSLFSYSSPSPYTWTISFRQLVGLGAGHALISNRRPFAHPYSLCLWCPLSSLSSHWC